MNIHKIKITGTTEINEKLEDNLDYSICLKRCSIKSIKKAPTHEDDGHIYTYNLENMDTAIIIAEGKTITGKTKSQAKKLRGRSFIYAQDKGIDEEEHYQTIMSKMILYYDEIMEFLESKSY